MIVRRRASGAKAARVRKANGEKAGVLQGIGLRQGTGRRAIAKAAVIGKDVVRSTVGAKAAGASEVTTGVVAIADASKVRLKSISRN
jgi:hypothetical protein